MLTLLYRLMYGFNRHISLCFLLLVTGFSTHGQSFVKHPDFAEVSELMNTNGVSVADYDQDGDLDIYVVAVRRFSEDNPQTWSRLLRNDLEEGYVDVTGESKLLANNEAIKIGAMGDRFAGSWGDYDNDGYPDLFLANNGADELWHNEGDGTFSNVTKTAGVQGCGSCYSVNGLWWDYDVDGDLDLYVSDWILSNRQYENNGDGTFTEVAEKVGLDDNYSQTWSALPLDVNKDGLPDLYVVNDFGDNHLLVNDGKGVFEDLTSSFGLEDDGEGMGVDICDYNNDGHFDIYVTNIYDREPNPFFVGSFEGTFTDKASEVGIENTGWGWSARFFDADHDLDEDAYVVNGFFLKAGQDNRNLFFLNEEGNFRNIASQLGVNNIEQARGMEVFDHDLDGDLDILIANRGANLILYTNQTIEKEDQSGNWLQIKLEGTNSHKDAYGSIVKITCENRSYHRYHTGANIFGQSLKPIHFGLADFEHVDQVEVTWPGGTIEAFYDFDANQVITIREGEGEVVTRRVLSVPDAQVEVQVFPNPFDQQLWFELSAVGPGPFIIELRDLSGSVVISEVMEITSNEMQHVVELEGKNLPTGCYIYYILGHGFEHSGKVYKVR